jgi:hypothetical protein
MKARIPECVMMHRASHMLIFETEEGKLMAAGAGCLMILRFG